MDVHVKLDENGYIPDAYAKHADPNALVPLRGHGRSRRSGHARRGLLRRRLHPRVRVPLDPLVRLRNSGKCRHVPRGRLQPALRLTCRYNGPQPPDRDHTYTLRVYALDNAPQLREGFWLNELLHAMEGHILGEAVAQLPARV